MRKRNVALLIAGQILQWSKKFAVKRHPQRPARLSELAITMVKDEDAYEAAMRRSLKRLDDTRPLESDHTWSRESLHER